uniref:NADAR domain-containing protein n=1 Tax=Globodera rostochiensis TaxID=31243 RepID=A0A914HXX6_GLORO
MNGGTSIQQLHEEFDLREGIRFGDRSPTNSENSGAQILRPTNGIHGKGASSSKDGTNSESAHRKNFSSSLLHGAFSTPLTASFSKFVKPPPPPPPPIGSELFAENSGRSDFDGSNLSSPSLSNRQICPFSSPPRKKWFLREFPNSSTASASSSNEANSFNSPLDSDDPFAFKPVPVMFINHFRCASLIIDGQRYICTEQYYMFYKARVFGDKRAMRQIMVTEDAKLMKKIGANVEGFDQEKWYKIAIQVMVIASVKKYEQNPELRRQLFETSGADLVEVNPTDQRWGIGLAMGDWRVREKRMWKGLNWLGRLLTMLRDKLLERPEFASEKDELLGEISSSFETAESIGCLQRSDWQPEGEKPLLQQVNDQTAPTPSP